MYANITRAAVCATVSAIWRERNNRRFRGVIFEARIIAGKLVNDLKNSLQLQLGEIQHSLPTCELLARLNISFSSRPRRITKVRWNAPDHNVYKINSDGALAGGRGGYGGVIRNSGGQVLACYRGPSPKLNITFLEILGICEGLKLALSLGLGTVIVESDSLQAINILNKEESCPWYCSNSVNEILNLVASFFHVKFIHVFREANMVADMLAKSSLCEFCTPIVFVPPLSREMEKIVISDKDGTWYNRFEKYR